MSALAECRPAGRHLVLVTAVVASVGCGGEQPDGACGGEVCEVPDSRAQLLDAVAGFEDPVAAYLREAAAEDGTIGEHWREVLDGVGDAMGCSDDTERSFVVLSNLGLAPKGLVTRCSDEPQAASRVFAIFEPDAERGDLDAERFRLVGWDTQAQAYRRYQMVPREGALGVSVEPRFCAGCHGGPFGMTRWVPIMNEMTNPWAQWNAKPGFESFLFEELLDEGHTGPVFDEVSAAQRLDSASNLEPIVRAAVDRVTAARIAQRSDAADLDTALALLRPVFCDETLNFVSEVHRSGEIQASAVVDPGLRRMFVALDPSGWPWAWLRDDTLFLAAPADDASPLALMAVRGETTLQAEAALVSRGVLTPMQVLRVRALDWTHPVESSLRCSLYDQGQQRLQQQGPDPADFADNAALIPAVYEALMSWQTQDGPVSLVTDADHLIAIADASTEAATAALAEGQLDAYRVTPAELGDAIESHVDTLLADADARAQLDTERVRRGCLARKKFPTAPIIPGADEC